MLKKGIFIFCLGLMLVLPSEGYGLSQGKRGPFNTPNPPRLLYPIADKVALAGKDFLEFKWLITDLITLQYYDFRLYKGYNTYADNLLIKKRIENNLSSVRIPAQTFENGEVYTWTLRVVDNGGQKSDSVYSSFKILSK